MSFAREDFLTDAWRMRDPQSLDFLPRIVPIIGSRQNRLFGRDWYQYRTEIDLLLEHDAARELMATNPVIQGVMEDLASFVVGTGYTPKVDVPWREEENRRFRSIAKTTQRYLEEWAENKPSIDLIIEGTYCREPSWRQLETEAFINGRVDGDSFIRYFYDRLHGLKCRRIEPEFITTPVNETPIGPVGFGVEHFVSEQGEDVARIIAYNQRDPVSLEEQRIPASKMSYYKVNTPSNIKRGVSDFFSIYDDARRINGLIVSLLTGATLRASIAWLEVIENGAPGASADLAAKLATRYRTDPASGNIVAERKISPGTIVQQNGNVKVETMPQGNTSENIEVYETALKFLARRWGMPEDMISGNIGDMNYSTMLAAGTPFTTRCLRTQTEYGNQLVLPTYVHAIAAGVYSRQLPWESLQCVLGVIAPTPVMNEKLEEAQIQQIRLQNKTTSPQKVMQENGDDPEKIMQQWREWEEEFPTQEFSPDLAMAMGEENGSREQRPHEASLANAKRATTSIRGE